MVTPKKGDFPGIPLNPEGRKLANAWDPAKDEAGGDQCKAYGAAGIMRMPTRLHITWQDDNTLRIDTDAGHKLGCSTFAAQIASRRSAVARHVERRSGNSCAPRFRRTCPVPFAAAA